MTKQNVAFANEILRGVVGSTAHGTAIDGQDDRDEMGVFIEPAEFVCGLAPLDHYVYRDKPDGVRSEPGDLDLTFYSLRKFCRLAVQGNPSVVVLLWLPEYEVISEAGAQLVSIREAFISRESGQRFLGYLVAQKMKMTGERAQTVNRPELVEKYGFDVKFAHHALRLGLQGIELLSEGHLTLPVKDPQLTMLRAIRLGAFTKEDALFQIERAESRLRSLVDACDKFVDREAINKFLVEAHLAHWKR